MARRPRIALPGGLYHVTSRGDRREDTCRDDRDRAAWLALFGEVCGRCNWGCHAYCQMTNHYHAVMETADANLSKGVRQLNGVYTQRFNRRHGLSGHRFQGRFKAIVVERDAYLPEFGRYVVPKPVRAGTIPEVSAWPWSSYGAMVGPASTPPWLEADRVLSQLGRQRKSASPRYAAFVAAGIGQPRTWEGLRHLVFPGSDAFVNRLGDSTPTRAGRREVTRAQRRFRAKALPELETEHPSRREAMARDLLTGVYTLREIADYFRVHCSTVSRAARWLEERRPRALKVKDQGGA